MNLKIQLPFILILSLILTGCHTNKLINSISFEELEHGVYLRDNETQIISDSNSPTKVKGNGYSKFILQSDTIKLKYKIGFGVGFRINSKFDKEIEIKVVWKLPSPMYSPITNMTYNEVIVNQSFYTNSYRYEAYFFDEKFELIPGKWTMEIYIGNKLLNSRKFIVIQ